MHRRIREKLITEFFCDFQMELSVNNAQTNPNIFINLRHPSITLHFCHTYVSDLAPLSFMIPLLRPPASDGTFPAAMLLVLDDSAVCPCVCVSIYNAVAVMDE